MIKTHLKQRGFIWESVAAAIAAASVFGPGCTIDVQVGETTGSSASSASSGSPQGECDTDADCASLGPGASCSPEKTCVVAGECAANLDCQSLGAGYICRKSDSKCVSLISPECPTFYPENTDLSNDNVLILGSILPTSNGYEVIGKPAENSIKLAIDFINDQAGGVPSGPGGAPRPLVLVGCDDEGQSDVAVTAAHHLAVELGVPAIIGSSFSGTTVTIANEVTIPQGTLLISPSATSDTITTLSDNGLVWRTSPPDVLQAKVLAAYAPTVEQEIRDESMLAPNEPIRAMIIHNDDLYGVSIGSALEQKLTVNGAPALAQVNTYYKRVQYTFTNESWAQAAEEAISFQPHVIYMIGFTEAPTSIAGPIEVNWSNGAFRPRYVFSDGAFIPDTSAMINDQGALATDLARRVTGTTPGSTSSFLYQTFKVAYMTTYMDASPDEPDTFGAAGAYDATYLLAFSAAAAAAAGAPPTGASLAEGLLRLIPPSMGSATVVSVSPSEIEVGFDLLSQGLTIDVKGTSGPLNFDPAVGEAESDIQIWCVPTDDAGNALLPAYSGMAYFSDAGILDGQFVPPCAKAP